MEARVRVRRPDADRAASGKFYRGLQRFACLVCCVVACQAVLLFHAAPWLEKEIGDHLFHADSAAEWRSVARGGPGAEAAAPSLRARLRSRSQRQQLHQQPQPPPPPQPPRGFGGLPPAPSTIPRLIHQSWKDAGFPKTIFDWRWQRGLLDLNPGWQLMQWTDDSSRELIAREYPWFLPTYDAYPSYIQRCDAARYFIVYHHGGVYADLDIECSRPFAPVLAGARAVFSHKLGTNMSRGLVNALFASEARHPLWRTVFELLLNRSGTAHRSASDEPAAPWAARAARPGTAHGAGLGSGAATQLTLTPGLTHLEVVRSTGPALLREAVLLLRSRGELDPLGVRLCWTSANKPHRCNHICNQIAVTTSVTTVR